MGTRPVSRTQGAVAQGAAVVGGAWIVTNAGTPTDGPSGTRAGTATTGTLLIDATNGKLYQNSGSLASPTWTLVADQTA